MCFAVSASVFLCTAGSAWAEADYPSDLEIVTESRVQRWEGETRDFTSHEWMLGIGLQWSPVYWFSVHGRIGAGWLATPDYDVAYRYHNGEKKTRHWGVIGVAAAVDFRPGVRAFGFTGEVDARCHVTSYRAGLYAVTAGGGVFAEIDEWRGSVAFFRIGVMARWAVHDDAVKELTVERRGPEIAIRATMGF